MKALALVDTPDHVCCRYRVRAFEPALSRAGWSLALRPVHRGALGRWLQMARLPRLDAVILQRKLLPAWHLRALRRGARHLVFDFDDAVLYRDSFDPRGPHCPRRARRFTATVRAADVVVAGNDFLADCALRAGARPERVRVIPTCIPTDRYRPADGPDGDGGDGLELVWIGSSSTLKGLEQTRPLWERLAREVPGVRMRVICDRFPDLGAMPVIGAPWSGETEARDLAAADAGVAWMPDDLWSRGKCGLKVLQYQAAGLAVLANPVGVHAEMVRPGVSGFLPATDDAWVAAARALSDDRRRTRAMGLAGRESVETGYSVAAWEGAFVATLSGSTAVPTPCFRRPRRPGAALSTATPQGRPGRQGPARGERRQAGDGSPKHDGTRA